MGFMAMVIAYVPAALLVLLLVGFRTARMVAIEQQHTDGGTIMTRDARAKVQATRTPVTMKSTGLKAIRVVWAEDGFSTRKQITAAITVAVLATGFIIYCVVSASNSAGSNWYASGQKYVEASHAASGSFAAMVGYTPKWYCQHTLAMFDSTGQDSLGVTECPADHDRHSSRAVGRRMYCGDHALPEWRLT
jgi:hypothetical protein